jgi:hypothetical protein
MPYVVVMASQGFSGLVGWAAGAALYLCAMNFSLKNASLFAFGAFLLGCNTAPEQEQQAPVAVAEEAVMAQHDSLMAQTSQLYELKAKLVATKSPAIGPYLRGLQAADNVMMAWMHQYQAPDSTQAVDQRLAYFQQQQQILEAVDKQQRGTIDSATAFLKQQPAAAPAATK